MNQETQSAEYTVVARRYRPQSFTEMVGQNHIAQALGNAITQNRVGHAYLFTGARGVGKTSSARIFAKCLNCESGPTSTPCNDCDICQSVSVGEDIDVLEIDGASNRGIDEIRQLRSNAIVRPSRAKFKIYIIDEVHMLTQQAFNALLKTLEEPPEHVKFIFCTTDPQKIPITVLSRCQRFDFSPVQTPDITKRLQEICENENVVYEDEALAVLARRAAGSMRDSQSLLEQLLSFCSEKIGVEDVHQLLGTADTGRIKEIVAAVSEKNAAAGLEQVAAAMLAGVDAGQLAAQLLGYFRDIMAIRVGASAETLLVCTEPEIDALKEIGDQLGLETILAIVQTLDQSITRMQTSIHSRTLLEVAVVRLCNLENLESIADLVETLSTQNAGMRTAPPVGAAQKKNNEPKKLNSTNAAKPAMTGGRNDEDALVAPVANVTLNQQNVKQAWNQASEFVGGMTCDMAQKATKVSFDGGKVVAEFQDRHLFEMCRKPERARSLEDGIKAVTGVNAKIEFVINEVEQKKPRPAEPKMSRVQMMRQLEQNEMVKNAMSAFEAEIVEFRELRPKKS